MAVGSSELSCIDGDGLFSQELSREVLVGVGDAAHRPGACVEGAPGAAAQETCGEPRCAAACASGTLLYRDVRTSRAWLHFQDVPTEAVRTLLKAEGWRYSGRRTAWHNPRRFVQPPSRVPHVYAGECDYSGERAELLTERAGRVSAEAAVAHAKVAAIAEAIPFGQPILVGHHSEKRHRRDVRRIDSGTRKSVELAAEARSLESRAEASDALHAHQDSARGLTKKIERLETEKRGLQRQVIRAGTSVRTTELLALLEEQLVSARGRLAACPPLPCDTLTVAVGDKVRLRDYVVAIARVNPKTYSGVILEGGAAGMTGKWQREDLRAVLAKAAFTPSEVRGLMDRKR